MSYRNFVLATALLLQVAPAHASTWEIDSAHTSAQFAVKHLMVSTVRGTLGKVTGAAQIDDRDIAKSSVEASIDVNGIDTNEPKRDEHLKAADFLDTAKFPTITFKSKSVAAAGPDKYKVTGDLTMHGVTKEVVLDVEGTTAPTTDPWGNQKLGGVAKTRINRQDFGVSFNKTLDNGGLVVGNDIDVTIDIELNKKK